MTSESVATVTKCKYCTSLLIDSFLDTTFCPFLEKTQTQDAHADTMETVSLIYIFSQRER